MLPRVVWTLLGTVSLLAVVTGVLLLTILAPRQSLGGHVTSRGVVLTAPGVAALTGGDLTVTVSGTGPMFVGAARQVDATAWVADATAILVTGLADSRSLRTDQVAGAGPVADPRTAEVWLESASGDGTTSYVVSRPQPDWAVVAVGPGDVSLTWQRHVRHPAGWPLVVIGCLAFAVAVRGLAVRNAALRKERRSRAGARRVTSRGGQAR